MFEGIQKFLVSKFSKVINFVKFQTKIYFLIPVIPPVRWSEEAILLEFPARKWTSSATRTRICSFASPWIIDRLIFAIDYFFQTKISWNCALSCHPLIYPIVLNFSCIVIKNSSFPNRFFLEFFQGRDAQTCVILEVKNPKTSDTIKFERLPSLGLKANFSKYICHHNYRYTKTNL